MALPFISSISSSVRKIILKIIRDLVDKKNGALIFYNDVERSAVVNLIKTVRSENKMLLQTNEAF